MSFRKKENSLSDYALFFAPFELKFFFSNWDSGFALYTSEETFEKEFATIPEVSFFIEIGIFYMFTDAHKSHHVFSKLEIDWNTSRIFVRRFRK